MDAFGGKRRVRVRARRAVRCRRRKSEAPKPARLLRRTASAAASSGRVAGHKRLVQALKMVFIVCRCRHTVNSQKGMVNALDWLDAVSFRRDRQERGMIRTGRDL